MFDTKEDAIQKLAGSVVLYDGRPVHINSAKGSKDKVVIEFSDLRTGGEKAVPIKDKGWNFQNLGDKLGYTNVDLGTGSYKEALYLTRSAVRNVKSCQGLSGHNMKIPSLRGAKRLGLGKNSIGWPQLYTSTFFLDTLEQKYPSLSDIGKHFAKDPWLSSKAFSREFAVRRPDVGPFFLEYKGKDVGHSEDFSKWKLSEQFDYLRESLNHVLKVS